MPFHNEEEKTEEKKCKCPEGKCRCEYGKKKADKADDAYKGGFFTNLLKGGEGQARGGKYKSRKRVASKGKWHWQYKYDEPKKKGRGSRLKELLAALMSADSVPMNAMTSMINKMSLGELLKMRGTLTKRVKQLGQDKDKTKGGGAESDEKKEPKEKKKTEEPKEPKEKRMSMASLLKMVNARIAQLQGEEKGATAKTDEKFKEAMAAKKKEGESEDNFETMEEGEKKKEAKPRGASDLIESLAEINKMKGPLTVTDLGEENIYFTDGDGNPYYMKDITPSYPDGDKILAKLGVRSTKSGYELTGKEEGVDAALLAGHHSGDPEATQKLQARATELLPGIRMGDAVTVVATASENNGKLPKEFVEQMIRENRVAGKKETKPKGVNVSMGSLSEARKQRNIIAKNTGKEAPFRAPHYSVSTKPLLKEADMASGGVLYLDELQSYAAPAIKALKEKLDGMDNPPSIFVSESPAMSNPEAANRHKKYRQVLAGTGPGTPGVRDAATLTAVAEEATKVKEVGADDVPESHRRKDNIATAAKNAASDTRESLVTKPNGDVRLSLGDGSGKSADVRVGNDTYYKQAVDRLATAIGRLQAPSDPLVTAAVASSVKEAAKIIISRSKGRFKTPTGEKSATVEELVRDVQAKNLKAAQEKTKSSAFEELVQMEKEAKEKAPPASGLSTPGTKPASFPLGQKEWELLVALKNAGDHTPEAKKLLKENDKAAWKLKENTMVGLFAGSLNNEVTDKFFAEAKKEAEKKPRTDKAKTEEAKTEEAGGKSAWRAEKIRDQDPGQIPELAGLLKITDVESMRSALDELKQKGKVSGDSVREGKKGSTIFSVYFEDHDVVGEITVSPKETAPKSKGEAKTEEKSLNPWDSEGMMSHEDRLKEIHDDGYLSTPALKPGKHGGSRNEEENAKRHAKYEKQHKEMVEAGHLEDLGHGVYADAGPTKAPKGKKGTVAMIPPSEFGKPVEERKTVDIPATIHGKGDWAITKDPADKGKVRVTNVESGLGFGGTMTGPQANYMMDHLMDMEAKGELDGFDPNNMSSAVSKKATDAIKKLNDHANEEANRNNPIWSRRNKAKREANRRGKVKEAHDSATASASTNPGDFKQDTKTHDSVESAHKRSSAFESTDAGREQINQSTVADHDGQRYMVSTDGHRMAMIPVSDNVEAGKSYHHEVVGAKAAVRTTSTTMGSKAVAGKKTGKVVESDKADFPQFQSLLKKPDPANTHTFDAAALLDQAHHATTDPASDKKSKFPQVHIFTEDGGVHAQAEHTAAYSDHKDENHRALHGKKHTAAGKHKGSGKTTTINGAYLKQALEGAKGSVQVQYTGPLDPVILTRSDGEKHVIMPLRADLPANHPHNAATGKERDSAKKGFFSDKASEFKKGAAGTSSFFSDTIQRITKA